MAAACAAAYPKNCRALITEAAHSFVEERTLKGVREAKRAFARRGQLDRLKKYHGEKAAWVLSAWVDTWLSRDYRDWSLDGVLSRVRCPLLAFFGDSDEYGSKRQLERFAALPSGPTLTKLLPGCGHVPHREKPEAVLAAVKAFLATPGL